MTGTSLVSARSSARGKTIGGKATGVSGPGRFGDETVGLEEGTAVVDGDSVRAGVWHLVCISVVFLFGVRLCVAMCIQYTCSYGCIIH